jgi:gamma-glutamyl-gamma-aminobutyrate hydrolase PuuD
VNTAKVWIVEGNQQYINMFQHQGWEVVSSIEEADLVQFTGGSDVSPDMYGEKAHPYTSANPLRDEREARIFRIATHLKKPMAGICRGGQFLNVMCGGWLYQHVNNHAIHGTHTAINVETNCILPVTSTHHQMMRAGLDARILGIASESTQCENMEGGSLNYHDQEDGTDVEVLFYPKEKVLCFQPHPEYMELVAPCQKWYFKLIKDKLGVSADAEDEEGQG